MASPRPFAAYEFLIAWRYLRAKRAEGGVSVMTWISLIGIMLGSFVGVRLLKVAKPTFIRWMVIGILLFAGLKAVQKGLSSMGIL